AFMKRTPGDNKTPLPTATVVAAVTGQRKSKYAATVKPKSLTDEEFEAMTGANKIADGEAAEARASKKSTRTPKAEQPKNTFRLRDLYAQFDNAGKPVRVVARAHKKELSPMYVGGEKYLFANSDREKVVKIITDGLKEMKDKPAKVKGAKKSS